MYKEFLNLFILSMRVFLNISMLKGYFVPLQVTEALARAGLESSNLIVGIDFTKSNEWTGKAFNLIMYTVHNVYGSFHSFVIKYADLCFVNRCKVIQQKKLASHRRESKSL